MPVVTSLPIHLWSLGYFFPWPLVWEVSIDWSFSVDAELVETFTGYTDTSTITGGGNGSVVIGCDPTRIALSSGANVTPETFLVTKRLLSTVEESQKFRLFCSQSAAAGTYSVTETIETDFDDPNEQDITDTVTSSGSVTVTGLQIEIGPQTVTVQGLGLNSSGSGLPLWMPPSSWTFNRADLFTAQTQSQSKTAAQIGYDTGVGYEQSVTLQLTSWADRPL